MERNVKSNRFRRRRLLLLLIALLFTMVLFTTSTYAWFTANQTVAVSRLTVNVEAKNGIQISADGTNWKSIVQTADLKGASAGAYGDAINQIPSSMEPVSTVGNVDDDGLMEMYYGTIGTNAGGDYILTATKSTEQDGETGKFIAFDLFFKVDALTDIFLTPTSGVRTTDQTDKGIKNASRIAFVVLGRADAGASVSTIQGLNNGTSSHVYMWEPNYDVHTAAAVSHAYDTYGITIEEEDEELLDYSGVKAAIASTDNVIVRRSSPTDYSTTNSSFFEDVSVDYSTIDGFSSSQQIFSLQAGITKVRIYMWIEGQDVDCENAASGGNIAFDLNISTEND